MSLKAENITKIYGKQKALDNISFEIKSGEITGFLGPNGAGKSTMMKIITGYILQDEGSIFLNNKNTKDNITEVRKNIGYLPEHNPLYLDMYVSEYLNFTGKIQGLKKLKEKTEKVIEMTGLTLERKKKIKALSKGYRQRLGLAAALIHDPEILILDEPTTGLDPNQIIEIRNLISQISENKTIMLSTHIMQEVEALCNRAIIVNHGKIVSDLQVSKSKKQNTIIVEFNSPVSNEELNKIENITEKIRINDKEWLISSKADENLPKMVFKFASENNLYLVSLKKEVKDIENIFREVTK